MKNKVVIAGVGMVPFKKPGQSESYDVMGATAARNALTDAGIDYKVVEQAYAGYVYGDSCSGQAALYQVGITGIPIYNVNNNCASGSSAFALAVQAVEGGTVDCAIAVGFEEMSPGAIDLVFPAKTSPLARHSESVAKLMGLTDAEQQLPPAVCMFGVQAEMLQKEYGVSDLALAKIAIKARKHAAHNPNAIFRDPLSEEQILVGQPIYRGLRKLFACPPSCGGASVVVCSEAFARKHGIRSDIHLIGKGSCSDRAEYFEGDVMDVLFRGVSREAA